MKTQNILQHSTINYIHRKLFLALVFMIFSLGRMSSHNILVSSFFGKLEMQYKLDMTLIWNYLAKLVLSFQSWVERTASYQIEGWAFKKTSHYDKMLCCGNNLDKMPFFFSFLCPAHPPVPADKSALNSRRFYFSEPLFVCDSLLQECFNLWQLPTTEIGSALNSTQARRHCL